MSRRKARGRRPGSQTENKTDTEVIAVEPLRCKRHSCRSTNVEKQRIIRRDEIHGINNKTGERYTEVIKQACQCKTCGQRFNTVIYKYDPEKWGQAPKVNNSPARPTGKKISGRTSKTSKQVEHPKGYCPSCGHTYRPIMFNKGSKICKICEQAREKAQTAAV